MTQLEDRYGTHRPARHKLVVIGCAALAVLAVGWLVWAVAFHGRPLVRSDLVTFDVAGQHSADATVAVVRRDQDVQASCLLRAQASDHSIVGELNFTVGPGSGATTEVTRSVRTERQATSVTLMGCTADGQTQPR